jgi:hypothetical protein
MPQSIAARTRAMTGSTRLASSSILSLEKLPVPAGRPGLRLTFSAWVFWLILCPFCFGEAIITKKQLYVKLMRHPISLASKMLITTATL